jgi:hypothetical protein
LGHCIALLGSFAKPLHRLNVIFRHALAFEIAETELTLRIWVTCFSPGLNFFNLFAVSFGLLPGQLKGNDTQQQQNHQHRPIRTHIGRLAGVLSEISKIHVRRPGHANWLVSGQVGSAETIARNFSDKFGH